jgi:hypothetical protein
VLALPAPDVLALVTGESVIAFVERGTLTEGDELDLVIAGDRAPADVKPAYRRWCNASLPPGAWIAVVVAVHPAALLDPTAGAARHVLATPADGDIAVLRVYGATRPVLSDDAFAARRTAAEGALAA